MLMCLVIVGRVRLIDVELALHRSKFRHDLCSVAATIFTFVQVKLIPADVRRTTRLVGARNDYEVCARVMRRPECHGT